MTANVVGDLAGHRACLLRFTRRSPGPYLHPPPDRPRVEALQCPPGRVAPEIQLARFLGNHRDLDPRRAAVLVSHLDYPQKLLELLVDRPGEVAPPLGGQDVHEAALDPALLTFGGFEAVYGLIELAAPLVDQRRESLHLVVRGESLGLRPGVVAGGAGGFVGVLSPDHRFLLLLALELSLPQLALQGIYRGRHNEPFPLLTYHSSTPAFYSNLRQMALQEGSPCCVHAGIQIIFRW